MKTLLVDAKNIEKAADIINGGGLAAVPTETVYGLAGSGLDAAAVRSIFEVKGRPERKALSLMVRGAEDMEKYWTLVPHAARALARRYWPGPLTLIMTAAEGIPTEVTAGGATVGLRCPDHPLTQQLLGLLDIPLAAPSANPSGAESPKTAEKVLEYFDGRIGVVIDGGECRLGMESTIVDLSTVPYRILRKGAIPVEEIEKTLVDGLTIFGITGGSGCGKTTALETLERLGALVIDCDEVYHELTCSSEKMKQELEARFGAVYNENGLDRKALGAVVFSDSAALEELDRITHKYVNDEVERRLRDWAMRGGKYAAIDAIALLESDIAPRCAATVGVIAPEEVRVRRLMAREGVSEEYARMRINAQKKNGYFEENCTFVISNDGTLEQFQDKCNKLFSEMLKEEK